MSTARRVALIIMLTVIARHLLSGEYGPFDRIVELGVFALILYEVIYGIVRQFKDNNRKKFLTRHVEAMSHMLDKGQSIRKSVPKQSHDRTYDAVEGKISEWKQSAMAWEAETRALLESNSTRASAVFILGEYGQQALIIHRDSGDSFPIVEDLRISYQRLTARMDSLINIMEKPE